MHLNEEDGQGETETALSNPRQEFKIGVESLETEKGRRCFLANIKKHELIVDDYTTVIDMIQRPSPSKGSPSDLVSTRLLVNLILSH